MTFFDSAGVCSLVARLFIFMLKIFRKTAVQFAFAIQWWWEENSRSKSDYINIIYTSTERHGKYTLSRFLWIACYVSKINHNISTKNQQHLWFRNRQKHKRTRKKNERLSNLWLGEILMIDNRRIIIHYQWQ